MGKNKKINRRHQLIESVRARRPQRPPFVATGFLFSTNPLIAQTLSSELSRLSHKEIDVRVLRTFFIFFQFFFSIFFNFFSIFLKAERSG